MQGAPSPEPGRREPWARLLLAHAFLCESREGKILRGRSRISSPLLPAFTACELPRSAALSRRATAPFSGLASGVVSCGHLARRAPLVSALFIVSRWSQARIEELSDADEAVMLADMVDGATKCVSRLSRTCGAACFSESARATRCPSFLAELRSAKPSSMLAQRTRQSTSRPPSRCALAAARCCAPSPRRNVESVARRECASLPISFLSSVHGVCSHARAEKCREHRDDRGRAEPH